jgi:hypothetical protein
MADLGPELTEMNLKALFAATLSWTFCTSTIKISLLLLYARIFPQRPFRLATFSLVGLVAIYCIGCLIFFLANCRPFAANFNPHLPGAVCGNQQAGWLGTGIANIVTDVLILSLPMRNVWHLQIPSRTKIAVAGVFGIGFITVVISIVRLVTILQINLSDFTYSTVPADIFSAFEPTLMITCACLPIMRPLFRNFLPTRSHSGRYANSHSHDLHSKRVNRSRTQGAGGSEIGMANLKSKGLGSKHRLSMQMQTKPDGFVRLSEDEVKMIEPHSEAPSTTVIERSNTPSSIESRHAGARESSRERARAGAQTPNVIEVVTDIVVERSKI